MITRIYLGMPAKPDQAAIEQLEAGLVEQVGGFTFYSGIDMRKDPATGGVVRELCFIYEIVHRDTPVAVQAIFNFGLAMKGLLQQQEVLLVHIPAEKEVL